MLGWNLVIAQPTPHFHTTSFVDEQAQKHAPVSEEVDLESPQPDSGASSIKGKEPASSYFQLEHVASDGHAEGKVGSPGPSRGSPAPSNGSFDTVVDPVSTLMSNTSLNDIDSAPSSPGASCSGTRRNRIETAFERQLRMQRDCPRPPTNPRPSPPKGSSSHLTSTG
ncbi:hypothetical protein HKX48_006689 [Thoreauomyces humboldtii]|nr:hypothetical protein HKX48_006689 [Thoreauomyces humboldtii]